MSTRVHAGTVTEFPPHTARNLVTVYQAKCSCGFISWHEHKETARGSIIGHLILIPDDIYEVEYEGEKVPV